MTFLWVIRILVSMVTIEDYGTSVVASGVPSGIDAYDMLDLCENVEREGEGSFRFDGVTDKDELIKRLNSNE